VLALGEGDGNGESSALTFAKPAARTNEIMIFHFMPANQSSVILPDLSADRKARIGIPERCPHLKPIDAMGGLSYSGEDSSTYTLNPADHDPKNLFSIHISCRRILSELLDARSKYRRR
jgi:hypothetical protein